MYFKKHLTNFKKHPFAQQQVDNMAYREMMYVGPWFSVTVTAGDTRHVWSHLWTDGGWSRWQKAGGEWTSALTGKTCCYEIE